MVVIARAVGCLARVLFFLMAVVRLWCLGFLFLVGTGVRFFFFCGLGFGGVYRVCVVISGSVALYFRDVLLLLSLRPTRVLVWFLVRLLFLCRFVFVVIALECAFVLKSRRMSFGNNRRVVVCSWVRWLFGWSVVIVFFLLLRLFFVCLFE
jgi:hypothetical protein